MIMSPFQGLGDYNRLVFAIIMLPLRGSSPSLFLFAPLFSRSLAPSILPLLPIAPSPLRSLNRPFVLLPQRIQVLHNKEFQQLREYLVAVITA